MGIKIADDGVSIHFTKKKERLDKDYYTCINRKCENYSCTSLSCDKGNYAVDCSRRIKDIIDIDKENNIIPSYYHKGKVDTIEFSLDNNLNFIQGNIIKYVVRYKEKNGLEDLEKAMEYLKRLMDHERELNK